MNSHNNIRLVPLFYNEALLNTMALERNANMSFLRDWRYTNTDTQKSWVESIQSDNTCEYFSICECKGNEIRDVVGYCGLDKIHLANRTAEISMLIFEKHKQKGAGKETVRILLSYAFAILNLNLVHAEVYRTTTNDQFWEKCGFKKEAILRQRKYWNNQYYDSIIMSITSGEYFDDNTN